MKISDNQPYNKGGYVVMGDLPEEQRNLFRQWIIEGGQTRPDIEQEGDRAMDCAYVWDYERWLWHWSRGQQAPILD